MRIKANQQGVELLRKMAQKLRESTEAIQSLCNDVSNASEEHRNVLGPHISVLNDTIDRIRQDVVTSSGDVETTTEKLETVAQSYEEIISRNPFRSLLNASGTAQVKDQKNDKNTKRSPLATEQFTEGLLEGKGYINGNSFSFIRTQQNGKSVLASSAGNVSGAQKPDKYKFDAKKSTLFIVEDKNYGIENGVDNLIRNISNQAVKRIENCLDADVPKGLMGNTESGHIDSLQLTFSIDLKGHYTHKDGSLVTVKELEDSNFKQRIIKRVTEKVGAEKVKKVGLRIVFLFGNMVNKSLDISMR